MFRFVKMYQSISVCYALFGFVWICRHLIGLTLDLLGFAVNSKIWKDLQRIAWICFDSKGFVQICLDLLGVINFVEICKI